MQRRPTQEEVFQCLSVLRDEAKKHHVAPRRLEYLEKLAMVESGGCQVPADGSKAFGMFQVIPKTWNAHAEAFGLDRTDSKKGDGRNSLRQQAIFAIKSTEHNERVLRKKVGIVNPDDGELYLIHFAGENVGVNALRLAKIDPNIPINNVMNQEAIDVNGSKSDGSLGVRITNNDGGYIPIKDFKVGDLANWANGKMGLPDKHKTEKTWQYKRNKFGIPESLGNWSSVAVIGIAVAALVAIGSVIFGDDDEVKAPPTPRRTPPRSRA